MKFFKLILVLPLFGVGCTNHWNSVPYGGKAPYYAIGGVEHPEKCGCCR